MTPARTSPFDPFIPGFSLGRITSGAVAGAVGGMLMGVLMLTHFAITDQIGEAGMLPQVQDILGTTNPLTVWIMHMAMSIGLGVVFSFFIAPHSYRSSIVWALGYVLVLGFILSQLVLRTLAGQAVQFDAGAAFALISHLAYGLGLGIVYVAFHNLEVREALDAQSPKWRAWGEREKDS